MVGQTIAHYRIVSQLGSGGMGVVYAAEDDRLGRPVALKFVPEDLAKDSQAISRLISEARTASSLNHANICTIHDIGEYDGRPFIVMELLQGQTLRDRLTTGPLKVHEIVNIGIQIADALDSAHRRHIVHRDIKPANLFLLDRGQVKILDFGLAKLVHRHTLEATVATTDLTVEGVTLGTVAYMSPEQVTGEALDGRTDLFSLGVVLYESATGHQPFTGKTSAVVFSAILNRGPVAPIVFNPEMPIRLQEIITTCLEKDRELRYQDAAGLRADLMRLRRDLESGHTGVHLTATPLAAEPRSQSIVSASGERAATTETARSEESRGRSTTVGGSRPAPFRLAAGGIAAIAVALAVAASYVLWQERSQRTTAAPTPPVAQSVPRDQLELATASLRARNYRAALSFSEEVLRSVPEQPDALKIRNEARATIARFDEAVSQASRLLGAGDADGAATALDTARAIDPGAAIVSDLSAQLVNEFKRQGVVARKAREPRPPSTTAPSPRPSNAPAQSSVDRRHAPETPPPPASALPQPSAAVPAPPTPSEPAPSPRVESAERTPPAAAPPVTAPVASQPVPAPQTSAPSRADVAPAAPQPAEDDDAAIHRVVATYARAIETKDMALFRSVKPNLSTEEQRRVEEGFRAVASQRVSINILSIDRRGQEASVRLRRRDTIQAGGREQTAESQQTMTLVHTATGWTIREIGR